MKVGKLKQLLAKCDDDCDIFVAHGGSHELEVVAVIGSTNVEENRLHGYGLLTGTRQVLKAYIQKMDQMINQDPVMSAEWRRRKDFWLDEAKTLDAEPKFIEAEIL